VALRYFNVAGADPKGRSGQSTPRATHLIKVACETALGKRSRMQVFGTDYPTPDGTAIRDYIHVLDLAEAHLRALDYLRATDRSDVFNLGTGKGISVEEVLVAARRITGVPIPAEYVGRRPGDPVSVYADNTKARTLLAWQPRYGLEEIVSSAWRWHSAHPDGYG
jgi:UDP-glucose 4-epimerase